MKRQALILFLVSLAGLGIACDSSNNGDDNNGGVDTITGTWRGAVTSQGTPLTVEVELTQVLTEVTGSGFVDTPSERRTFAIIEGVGGYLHPTISLHLLFDGPPQYPGDLNANVTTDRTEMRGTLDGPGFAGIVELTLQRVSAP